MDDFAGGSFKQHIGTDALPSQAMLLRQFLSPACDGTVFAVELLWPIDFWEIGYEPAGFDEHAAAALDGVDDALVDDFGGLARGENADDSVHTGVFTTG